MDQSAIGARIREARLKKKMEKEKLANMSREELRFARIDEELSKIAEWFK